MKPPRLANHLGTFDHLFLSSAPSLKSLHTLSALVDTCTTGHNTIYDEISCKIASFKFTVSSTSWSEGPIAATPAQRYLDKASGIALFFSEIWQIVKFSLRQSNLGVMFYRSTCLMSSNKGLRSVNSSRPGHPSVQCFVFSRAHVSLQVVSFCLTARSGTNVYCCPPLTTAAGCELVACAYLLQEDIFQDLLAPVSHQGHSMSHFEKFDSLFYLVPYRLANHFKFPLKVFVPGELFF